MFLAKNIKKVAINTLLTKLTVAKVATILLAKNIENTHKYLANKAENSQISHKVC